MISTLTNSLTLIPVLEAESLPQSMSNTMTLHSFLEAGTFFSFLEANTDSPRFDSLTGELSSFKPDLQTSWTSFSGSTICSSHLSPLG